MDPMSSSDLSSILISIKKLIGLDKDYHAFDADLIIHINSVFMVLHQLGVGPKECFSITGDGETWETFLEGNKNAAAIKSYVYLKVKLLFDPPTTGVLHEAMEREIQEFEWRVNMQDDTLHRANIGEVIFEKEGEDE